MRDVRLPCLHTETLCAENPFLSLWMLAQLHVAAQHSLSTLWMPSIGGQMPAFARVLPQHLSCRVRLTVVEGAYVSGVDAWCWHVPHVDVGVGMLGCWHM